jgi:hypothetical protein
LVLNPITCSARGWPGSAELAFAFTAYSVQLLMHFPQEIFKSMSFRVDGGYTTVDTLGSGFSGPYGVAVDGSGNVFVADTLNNVVKEILAAGGYTTTR